MQFITFLLLLLVALVALGGVIHSTDSSALSDVTYGSTYSTLSAKKQPRRNNTSSTTYLIQLKARPNTYDIFEASLQRRNLSCGWADTISIGRTFRCVVYDPNQCGPSIQAQSNCQIMMMLKRVSSDVITVEKNQNMYTQWARPAPLFQSVISRFHRRIGLGLSSFPRFQTPLKRTWVYSDDEDEDDETKDEEDFAAQNVETCLRYEYENENENKYDGEDPLSSETNEGLNGACQAHSPWHLIRISNKKPKLPIKGGQAGFEYDNNYSSISYVLDSKVAITDPEFQGRVQLGKDFTSDPEGSALSYHGTHVASLVASATFGSNKKALVINVPVIGQSGVASFAIILNGLAWATKDMAVRNLKRAVINISISGSYSSLVNDAANAAFDSGAIVVVAAGNKNEDACKYSPSSADKVIAVGATHSNDAVSTFSNFGKCVDILAPGEVIPGVNARAKGQTLFMSGTSMASPIVAGVISSWLSTGQLSTEVAGDISKLKAFIESKASKLISTNKRNTTDHVINNGWDGC